MRSGCATFWLAEESPDLKNCESSGIPWFLALPMVRALPLLGNGGGLANQRAGSHFARLSMSPTKASSHYA